MGEMYNKFKNDPVGGIAMRYAMTGPRKDLPLLVELTDGSKHWFRSQKQIGKDFDEYVFITEDGAVVLSFDDDDMPK